MHAVLLGALAGYGVATGSRNGHVLGPLAAYPILPVVAEAFLGRRARRAIVAERLNAQLADASRARRGADASAAARAFRDMERSPVVR